MIKLQVFGPAFGLVDPSPFVTKAHLLLRLAGIAYEPVRGNVRKAPKGKLPVLDDNGAIVADSTFIRRHIEKKYGFNYDAGLTPKQIGCAWAVEKMLEDHLYWALIRERWLEPENFARGPAHFFDALPTLLRPIVRRMVVKQVRSNAHGHGMGRHGTDEQTWLASRAITAVAQVLGDRRYLMRDQPCGADATVYAFLAGALCEMFDSPIRVEVKKHANLTAYAQRMEAQYFPEAKRAA
jgi:glutathione S-transferase